jgi:hypothetical protein
MSIISRCSWLASLLILGLSGLLSSTRGDDLPAPLSSTQQEHVHVFIIHGLDPLDYANLRGVRDYCHRHGYRHTTCAQFFHGPQVVSRICAVKASDPSAKILLFGFSAGTLTTRTVANTLHNKHGINVDVIVYTSGITMLDREYNRPSFVGKIIHIRDRSMITGGVELSSAENHKFNDAWHFGTASHDHTLAMLRRELDRLANDSPITLTPDLAHATQKVDTATPSSWDIARPSLTLLPPPRFVAK